MNKAECLGIAKKALAEMFAQIDDANGDIKTFNHRTQGPWFYEENEETQMDDDLVKIMKALDFIEAMEQEDES